jgi:uncharacterized protein (TIGR02996 family)
VAAFLRCIKDDPEDDAPRLILSDWLEERGDPRGEFVRLQCYRARLGTGRAAVELEAREAELLLKHRAEWLGVLAERGIDTEFRRGLVKAGGSSRKLLSKRLAKMLHAEALDWVDNLRIDDATAEAVAKLAISPHWTCLTRLDLSGRIYYADQLADRYTVGLGPQGGVALAALPLLSKVRELDLGLNDIGAEGVAALGALSHLGRLRSLSLRCNNLRDKGTAALASSRSLTGLTELHLNHNRIGAEGMAALATWPGLTHLNTLLLGGNYPGPQGAAALASSPYLGCLMKWSLRGDERGACSGLGRPQIGPEGAAALSRSANLTRLTEFDLSGNAIGPEGAAALATSDTLSCLAELDLSENEVGDEGAIALASSPALSRLKRLDLRYNGIGDRGALAFADSPYLSSLEYLNFRANRGAGLEAHVALRDRFGDALDTERAF